MEYIENAQNFIEQFAPYFKMLYKYREPLPRDLERLLSRFNTVHSTGYFVRSGCSRMVIVGGDFVIKMNYDGWGSGRAGGIEDEIEAFAMVEDAGFDYLFAKPTPFFYGEHMMVIMPRIVDVDEDRDFDDVDDLTEEECDFLNDNFFDLHGGNFGYTECGEFVVFDYAWRRIEY